MSVKATESGQPAAESEALPASQTSQPDGVSESSGSAPDGQALRAQFGPVITDLVNEAFEAKRRELQGDKDRGINQVRNEVKEMRGALELLKGLVPEDVLAPYADKIKGAELEQKVEALSQRLETQQQTAQPPAGKPQAEQYQQGVQDIFAKSGLVPQGQDVLNSPAYLEFFKAKGGAFQSMADVTEAALFVANKLAASKTPIPAAAGGHSPSEEVSTNTNSIKDVQDPAELIRIHEQGSQGG